MSDPLEPARPHFSDPTHFPADKLIELCLLGKVLIEQSLDGLEFVQPADFYSDPHGEIWDRMHHLWDAGVELDPILIADRDPEIHSILAEAISLPEPLTPATVYARRLRDLAQKRRMLPLLNRVAEMSLNGVPYGEVVRYLETEMDRDERRVDRDTWQVRRASGLVEPPASREWLLDGLIFKGQISMWFGPPGIKKTLLLMDACAAMAMGQNWLVRRMNQADHPSLVTFHTKRRVRVLWIDFDNGEFETEIRVRAALQARKGLEDAEFFYISEASPWLALDDASHVRRIIRMALDIGADVIVIDALGMVMGDVDENSPGVARVISKLKEMRAATGAAIICVHHPSKAGAQNDTSTTYNAAGSAKFSNFFEWSVELRAGEERDTIVANVVKHRGYAKTTRFAAELSYEHFGAEHPELAHELSVFKFYSAVCESVGEKRVGAIRETILEILEQCDMNQQQLIDASKVKIESLLGKTVGAFAIREEVKVMAKERIITATQSAPRQPIVYSLPAYAAH